MAFGLFVQYKTLKSYNTVSGGHQPIFHEQIMNVPQKIGNNQQMMNMSSNIAQAIAYVRMRQSEGGVSIYDNKWPLPHCPTVAASDAL